MKLYEVLAQSQTSYLYEGLTPSVKKSMQLWESAGNKLVEAELTVDQINQIFTQVEKDTTGAGGNRTLLGKGKDAASAVNRAWEDLKTKIQNSEPVKNVDAMYDQAADKLKQATGGDQGVMQYVQKYRDFAKKHPVAQSFIYAALIAAAGISGAGAGGAAALGLFKMVDKLLQGEKFSSAAYSGAKTGAAAYAAGQIGKAMQGDQAGAVDAADAAQSASGGLQRVGMDFWKESHFGDELTRFLNDPTVKQAYKDELVKQLNKSLVNPDNKTSIADAWRLAKKVANIRAGNPYESVATFTAGIKLSETQIRKICQLTTHQLNEGPLDAIKGLAQKGIAKAKTVGHNLTTKITADKLMQAWKKAGSPTDSDAVANILIKAGANKDIVNNAISAIAGEPVGSTATSTDDTANVQEPNAAQEPAPAASGNKFKDMIAKLTDYIDNGGNVTPKLRGAVKNIWMQMGGVRIESRD